MYCTQVHSLHTSLMVINQNIGVAQMSLNGKIGAKEYLRSYAMYYMLGLTRPI